MTAGSVGVARPLSLVGRPWSFLEPPEGFEPSGDRIHPPSGKTCGCRVRFGFSLGTRGSGGHHGLGVALGSGWWWPDPAPAGHVGGGEARSPRDLVQLYPRA